MDSFAAFLTSSRGFEETDNNAENTAVGSESNKSIDSTASQEQDPDEVSCLEGNLKVRKGRATGNGSLRWRERFVHLSFAEGGSIYVYDQAPESNSARELHEDAKLLIFIPTDLPWVAKDVNNTTATFAIEIPTGEETGGDLDDDFSVQQSVAADSVSTSVLDEEESRLAADGLNAEIERAKKRGKPFRIYFQCQKGGNEKALWLEAFDILHRLSHAKRRTSGIRSAFANNVRFVRPHRGRARKRQHAIEHYDRTPMDSGEFDENDDGTNNVSSRINQMVYGRPMRKSEGKEYKVIPGYAYPHRWMNIHELYDEMMAPSAHFHDLRDPNIPAVGHLRVEVLQCVGLPRLDRASDTDGVVYLVCGPCAFVTDVIPDRTNPMWLRKTRRACIFPIYNGYARLYVGVFDDDGERAKDDFAGRVLVDVARLRHSSQYDVTLPLRLSAHAYTRRPRGAVRLRLTLELKSEKDMLLSYLPKKVKIVPPMRSKPDLSTTIPCADHKSFRNIAITVHGVDMPGKFSFGKIKAAIKEISFSIKFIIAFIRQEIKDTKNWVNPTISGFIFVAWMHCIYEDTFHLVPGYLGLYLLLQLSRSYAIYAIEGPMQQGFLPPTFEEMFGVLVSSRSNVAIEPLDLHRKSGLSTSTHGLRNSAVGFDPDAIEITTHTPRGLWIFKVLGFIPWRESKRRKRNLHMEFPFADGEVYEDFTLKDCLADIRPIAEAEKDDDEEYDFENSSSVSVVDSPAVTPSTSSSVISSLSPRAWTGSSSASAEFGGDDEDDEDNEEDDDDEDESDEDDSQSMSFSLTELPVEGNPVAAVAQTAEALTPTFIRKDQDMDWRKPSKDGEAKSKDEKLTHSIEKIASKLHAITWHSFHDHVYDVKKEDAVYFNEAKSLEKRGIRNRRHKKKSLDKKLNRLLGVKEYSNSRAIISRVGLLIEPIIGSVYGFLCAVRAFFNLTTWQDPYLTFLLAVALAVITLVLFLMPWRPVLFIVGMLFVGPQNWLIRILRENGTLPPKKPREHTEEPQLEDNREAFHSHQRVDGLGAPKPDPPVDPLEVQHIVVPYSPFMYQRMYDWPPEQQYATVVPVSERASMLNRDMDGISVRSSIASTDHSGREQRPPGPRFPRLQRLRRRNRKNKGSELAPMLEEQEDQNFEDPVTPTDMKKEDEG